LVSRVDALHVMQGLLVVSTVVIDNSTSGVVDSKWLPCVVVNFTTTQGSFSFQLLEKLGMLCSHCYVTLRHVDDVSNTGCW
jgi:hypothetical protein